MLFINEGMFGKPLLTTVPVADGNTQPGRLRVVFTQVKGVDLELLSLPLDDPKTFELLQRGDTLGVFQFDGGPMRSLLRLMKSDNFEDISAVSALYRPGPMGMDSHTNYALRKNKLQEITPDPPRAGGAPQGGPGRHLRPDRVPGAGAEGRPDHRRLLARRGRHPPPRHGQEEARRTGEELRPPSTTSSARAGASR
ncbi:hypothetical protein GCM10023086_76840 [Streptomyces venetus]|uniref:DNA polymerase III alpha subunit finger domain-containing protein n=1 Tax=Streptomyces venetus TaxID=1701086 RepID=A0ABP8HMA5_9ACTN